MQLRTSTIIKLLKLAIIPFKKGKKRSLKRIESMKDSRIFEYHFCLSPQPSHLLPLYPLYIFIVLSRHNLSSNEYTAAFDALIIIQNDEKKCPQEIGIDEDEKNKCDLTLKYSLQIHTRSILGQSQNKEEENKFEDDFTLPLHKSILTYASWREENRDQMMMVGHIYSSINTVLYSIHIVHATHTIEQRFSIGINRLWSRKDEFIMHSGRKTRL